MCQNNKLNHNKCQKSAKESIDSVKTELHFASKLAIRLSQEKCEVIEENISLYDMIEELKQEIDSLKSEVKTANKNVSIWQKVVFLLNGKSSNSTK